MENIEKDYLSLTEAAKMIGVCRQTLQKWIEKGKKAPRYGRIGDRYRFRREEVEKFVKDSMGEVDNE